MKKTIKYTIQQLDDVVRTFSEDIGAVSIVTLTGSLGAGKTAFVGALLKHWGVSSAVTSPTFAYVNIYELADGRTVYHFDLYRLKNMQEFEAAGFFEYLYQPKGVALIEWPEIIAPALLRDVCRVSLEVAGEVERIITYGLEDEQG